MSSIEQRRAAMTEVAMFLHLNYRGGVPATTWEDARPDERDGWEAEASYIVRLVVERTELAQDAALSVLRDLLNLRPFRVEDEFHVQARQLEAICKRARALVAEHTTDEETT